ncbi:disease resistance protein [Striga asiatica]|uniref:Disease resistance protein n=1 Tax=Striga asiatica TaxID=4170 RepID=A0A5A7QAG8_STRAF|nr:disease resistance protein [Striga asiatica]
MRTSRNYGLGPGSITAKKHKEFERLAFNKAKTLRAMRANMLSHWDGSKKLIDILPPIWKTEANRIYQELWEANRRNLNNRGMPTVNFYDLVVQVGRLWEEREVLLETKKEPTEEEPRMDGESSQGSN